jgi:hypothetical protein
MEPLPADDRILADNSTSTTSSSGWPASSQARSSSRVRQEISGRDGHDDDPFPRNSHERVSEHNHQ